MQQRQRPTKRIVCTRLISQLFRSNNCIGCKSTYSHRVSSSREICRRKDMHMGRSKVAANRCTVRVSVPASKIAPQHVKTCSLYTTIRRASSGLSSRCCSSSSSSNNSLRQLRTPCAPLNNSVGAKTLQTCLNICKKLKK